MLSVEYHLFEYIIPYSNKKINGLPLYIIKTEFCISSTRRVVYHQVAENTPSVMIYAYGDDIHAKAWWYTKSATWIKNKCRMYPILHLFLERITGLEPATSTLARWRSTKWAKSAWLLSLCGFEIGDSDGARLSRELRARSFAALTVINCHSLPLLLLAI